VLRRIDHIGVVVDDLDEAKAFLANVLGLRLDREVEVRELKRRVAFFACGDVSIEVIQDLDATARHTSLGGAKARIEHIAIEVDNLTETLGALSLLGVRSDAAGVIEAAGLRTTWTDPDSTDGVRYQFLVRNLAADPPNGGLPRASTGVLVPGETAPPATHRDD
jgi:methylmalonyl-CoA/ethylmalonyl-CoA epimerase